jgi:hypothetical protein
MFTVDRARAKLGRAYPLPSSAQAKAASEAGIVLAQGRAPARRRRRSSSARLAHAARHLTRPRQEPPCGRKAGGTPPALERAFE